MDSHSSARQILCALLVTDHNRCTNKLLQCQDTKKSFHTYSGNCQYTQTKNMHLCPRVALGLQQEVLNTVIYSTGTDVITPVE